MSEKPKSAKYLEYLRKKDLLDQEKKKLQASFVENSIEALEIEIKSIVDSKNDTGKKYAKNFLTPEQRIKMTLLAEKYGLCSWSSSETKCALVTDASDAKSKDGFFNIGCPAKEILGADNAPDFHIKRFNDIFNCQCEAIKGSIVADLKLFNLEAEFEMYRNDVYRYGGAGQSRRNTLLKDHIISEIQKSPGYKKYVKDDLKSILDRKEYIQYISPPFSIASLVYNPENHGKTFISLDLKAAVFLGYFNYGICSNASNAPNALDASNPFDESRYPTWEWYVSQYTKNELFIRNKPMRLTIFGKLNKSTNYLNPEANPRSCKTKNQILYQNLMVDFWLAILNKHEELEKYLVCIEGDEIVLSVPEQSLLTPIMKKLREMKFPSCLKMDTFELEVLDFDHIDQNDRKEFKDTKEVKVNEQSKSMKVYVKKYLTDDHKDGIKYTGKYDIKGVDVKFIRNIRLFLNKRTYGPSKAPTVLF